MRCALLAVLLVILVCYVEAAAVGGGLRTLRKEELDDNTRGWLLMVESGRTDDEKMRRITPKSVFIAPMLSSRSEQCKEGYRHDHIGRCVKIIKIDPNAQIALLLKRLSAMYSEVREEQKADGQLSVKPQESSSGPLQFSIPILNLDTTTKAVKKHKENLTSVVPEVLPIPMAMVEKNSTSHRMEVPAEGSGEGSGEGEAEHTTGWTTPTETSPTETTTETEDFGRLQEFSGDGAVTTTVQEAETAEGTRESQQTTVSMVDSTQIDDQTTVTPPSPRQVTLPTVSPGSRVRFPDSDTELSAAADPGVDGRVPEPGVTEGSGGTTEDAGTGETDSSVHPSDIKVVSDDGGAVEPAGPSHVEFLPPVFPSEVRTVHDRNHVPVSFPTSAPSRPSWEQTHEEFWWVPPNWRVDEDHEKSTLLKFWSRFPLVRDSSFVDPPGSRFSPPQHHSSIGVPSGSQFPPPQHHSSIADPPGSHFSASQPHTEPFRPSTRFEEYTVDLVPPSAPPSRRGRLYQDHVTPRRLPSNNHR